MKRNLIIILFLCFGVHLSAQDSLFADLESMVFSNASGLEKLAIKHKKKASCASLYGKEVCSHWLLYEKREHTPENVFDPISYDASLLMKLRVFFLDDRSFYFRDKMLAEIVQHSPIPVGAYNKEPLFYERNKYVFYQSDQRYMLVVWDEDEYESGEMKNRAVSIWFNGIFYRFVLENKDKDTYYKGYKIAFLADFIDVLGFRQDDYVFWANGGNYGEGITWLSQNETLEFIKRIQSPAAVQGDVLDK